VELPLPTSTTQPTEAAAAEPRYRACVGIMVLNRQGLVWAGHRVSKSHRDPEGQERWWQMPQGGIDASEDPAAAALRELEEETGMRSVTLLATSRDWRSYDFPPELVALQRGIIFRGQTQRWIAVRFKGPDEEIDIAAKAGITPEFDAWRWLPMGELPALVAPFKRAVYTDVVAEFSNLQGSQASSRDARASIEPPSHS
jgi:putative (di)nucleoside polyphosphate hydrolase